MGLTSIEGNKGDQWWCTHVARRVRSDLYFDMMTCAHMRPWMSIDMVADSDKLGPYLPGCSIQTDGLQIKVPVLSLRNMTPNLNKLFEKGYYGIPSKEPKNKNDKVNLSLQTRGVFRSRACLPLDPESDQSIMGIDPGHNW